MAGIPVMEFGALQDSWCLQMIRLLWASQILMADIAQTINLKCIRNNGKE